MVYGDFLGDIPFFFFWENEMLLALMEDLEGYRIGGCLEVEVGRGW